MLYDSYGSITSEVLNRLLVNQQVSITQEELERLKVIPGVKFDLPLTDVTFHAFVGLVGKPKTKVYRRPGVYVFTHKETGRKYVGSSNSLSRRLAQYFSEDQYFNQKDSGLFMPLLKKEGFKAFSLEIFAMPSEFSSDYYFLFLEQYHLLHKSFDLNTQRIVNFRVNQGKNIYLYDLEGKTLYYSSKSLNQIKDNLGIHVETCSKCIKKGESYLNFFKITDSPIAGASKANLDLLSLSQLILEKNKLNLENTTRARFSVPISIKEVETGKLWSFLVLNPPWNTFFKVKTLKQIEIKYLNV